MFCSCFIISYCAFLFCIFFVLHTFSYKLPLKLPNFFMFSYYHVTLFPGYKFFVLYFSDISLFSCYFFFHVALFSCLNTFCCTLPCCTLPFTLSRLHFFHFANLSCLTFHITLFTCNRFIIICSFFILHSFILDTFDVVRFSSFSLSSCTF